jgi:precorrin-6A synthase
VLVSGIGAGDPDHVTMQAVAALNAAEVFFVMEKGAAGELVRLRREICERYIEDTSYRIVEVRDPQRDRSAPDYAAAVAAWRSARADVWEALIAGELGEEDGCGAFLVWGDPALYDSTIAVLGEIAARGRVAFEFEVIPGISSVQALAAAHRVALNRVGEPVEITTGRRLLEDLGGDGDVVVMLDASNAFDAVEDRDTEIYWGAYVGTEHEILVSGRLRDVAEEIVRRRAEARERHGWIMDVYLLRRAR